MSLNAHSQNVIYSVDFEDYTPYIGIVEQVGFPWETWSGATGGSEDVIVSNEFSYSGENALNCKKGNDVVLNLEDISSGRYEISFYMLIKTNYVGYFNMLLDFEGKNSLWATSTFFYKDGSASTSAGESNAASFNYQHNEWFNVRFIVDLDDDFATMFINDNEITSWKWSRGISGNHSLSKLDAINFYGWSGRDGTGSNFFIDDIEITEISAPQTELELTAERNDNNVNLTWTGHNEMIESYILIRNDKVIASGISNTEYNDLNVYPSEYEYRIRAYIPGMGYSHSSNAVSIKIPGGVIRNMVLFEINTGTWCGYCPGAAMGADDLEEGDYEVAIIEYHNGDDYANNDCKIRENYYQVSGYPTTTVDGIEGMTGGSNNNSLINSYDMLYKKRENIPSTHEMNVEINNNGDEYTVNIDIQQQSSYFTGGLVLRTALVESHIEEYWQGLDELNFVCRKMYPDAYGTMLDFSAEDIASVSFDLSVAGYNKENCEFVAFIQHEATKEVVQTVRFDLGITNIESRERDVSVNLYPNPGNGIFYLDVINSRSQNISIDIVNSAGMIIERYQSKNVKVMSKVIDISDQPAGIYFARISNGSKVFVKRLNLIK